MTTEPTPQPQQPFKQRSLRNAARQGPIKRDPPPPVPAPTPPVLIQQNSAESKPVVEAKAPPPKKEKPKPPQKQQQPQSQQQGTLCSNCRAKRRRAEQRRKDNAGRAAAAEGECRGRHALGGRLPDGALFVMTYDAAKVQWNGTLTIKGFPEFQASASSLMGLDVELDKLYRAEVQRRLPAPTSEEPKHA